MDNLIEFIIAHKTAAPFIAFFLVLLAGFSLPISIDIILVACAFLAATALKSHAVSLYLSMVVGCALSAWIAYFIGRTFGKKLLKIKWFAKMLPADRLQKIRSFYEKHGFKTFIIGRFIPFGVRNCLFMSSGMSKMPFGKFVFRDGVGCFIWATVSFYLFFRLGQNLDTLVSYLKTFNVLIFSLFAVAVISYIWYKRKNVKSKRLQDEIQRD